MKALLVLSLIFSAPLFAVETSADKVKAIEEVHLKELDSQLDQKMQKAQGLINLITRKIHGHSLDEQKREDSEYALVGHIARLQAIREDRVAELHKQDQLSYEMLESYSKRTNALIKDLQSSLK